MAPETRDWLLEDTSFWVVRARIAGGSITGDSTVEALKDYFTGTSDMDAIPIPAISENISTAIAQRL